MNNEKSIKTNIIWNGILSISSIIFPLITFPYTARVLGVEVNGVINFVTSTVNYFALFATLGLSTYGVKACAQTKDNKLELSKVVHELFALSLASAIVVIFVLTLAVFIIPEFNQYKSYFFVYGLNIVGNVIGINWMYQGIEKYKYVTARSLIFKIISIVMMFMMVKTTADGLVYAAISVFATAGGNFFNFIHARKYISVSRIKNGFKYNIKQHINPMVILFATNLAVNVYSNLDSVMLGFIQGDYATGIYYVAVKIKTILLTLVSSFSVVMLSRLSFLSANKNDTHIIIMLKKSYSLLVMLTVPIILFFIVMSRESIMFLSGSDYLEAMLTMCILMPTIFISAISQIIGSQYSIAAGKEKNLMIAVIAGAFVNLILNALLIPKYSYNGAAIGTVFAELTQFIIQIFLAKEVVRRFMNLKSFLIVSFAALIATIITVLGKMLIPIGSSFFSLVVNAIIFFAIYILSLYTFKYDMCIETISYLKKIIIRG